jgi:hypothetical protein
VQLNFYDAIAFVQSILLPRLFTSFSLQGSAGAEPDKVQLQYSPLADVLAAPGEPLPATTHAMYYVLLGEARQCNTQEFD